MLHANLQSQITNFIREQALNRNGDSDQEFCEFLCTYVDVYCGINKKRNKEQLRDAKNFIKLQTLKGWKRSFTSKNSKNSKNLKQT